MAAEMLLNHVGLVSSSEEKSDRFFTGVLELEKTRTSRLSAELSSRLFGIDEDLEMLNYGNGDVLFEVFVPGRSDIAPHPVSHVCLEVPERSAFLERCAAMGVAIVEVPKGESVVVFVRDYDGNLYEIKEKR
jgi:catechol 2,3-dioxygenase-like lactoylglutathione lyase family enzyme